ncbi:MAG: A/G-specific adenine glycosylase [Aquabacterium sp.]|nr:A/G-specific adenine glycosylase [Aquabacterium sp.]
MTSPITSAARVAAPLDGRVAALGAGFSAQVVAWQRSHGRHDLPWQVRDPYRVWLSEIMLQQTQVATVLGYYGRFLQRFPDVATLAAAPLDEVLAAWAGLGYYSRARNLHRCAQVVMAEHAGRFPATAPALAELPGIGPSTAAAIAAFCFDERAAILDGNVKRVLARVLGHAGDLADKRQERALWQAAQDLLPPAAADMPAYTQGLMDLGATVCTTRRPACVVCPLSDLCIAAREGQPLAYPVKSRRLVRGARESWWLWLEHEGRIWLEQRPPSGVWAGLWSLPVFDSEAALRHALAQAGLSDPAVEPQPLVQHALTHFDWTLHPQRLVLAREDQAAAWTDRHLGGVSTGSTATLVSEPTSGRWVARGELAAYGLPAPLKKLLG